MKVPTTIWLYVLTPWCVHHTYIEELVEQILRLPGVQ
jgi:hypothetical protein